MKIPYVVMKDLDFTDIHNWEKYYKTPSSQIDHRIEEGLWRRTQVNENKEESGWRGEHDCRRRMVQYKHTYDLVQYGNESCIALVDTYIWLHYCLPENEANSYINKIQQILCSGSWELVYSTNERKLFKQNDIFYKITILDRHLEDLKENRKFPENYIMFEINVYSEKHKFDNSFMHHPWEVLKTGIRNKEKREEGKLDVNLEEIPSYFPAQVELGCGASIEAGIPPLNYLHKVYNVTDPETHKFILNLEKDELPFALAKKPQEKYKEIVYMFKQCFRARPTHFYKLLKEMHEEGLVVGDIITNNFDGLIPKIGLRERYVRRYDEANIIPEIKFHPNAKSLVVVGSHADRRKIQQSARSQGLKVIYLDPEGYLTPKGKVSYPLESLKKEDLYLNEGATESLTRIYNALKQTKETELLQK